jgi:hypothetical protein
VFVQVILSRLMSALQSASRAPYPAGTETISHRGRIMCMIVRTEPVPEHTTFYTPNQFNLQVGKIVYPARSEIRRHTHRPMIRCVAGTTEVLVVQKGRMIVDIYTEDQVFLCSREMVSGDVLLLLGGGHGFHLLEDTVLLEVKQGPYVGPQEKELF